MTEINARYFGDHTEDLDLDNPEKVTEYVQMLLQEITVVDQNKLPNAYRFLSREIEQVQALGKIPEGKRKLDIFTDLPITVTVKIKLPSDLKVNALKLLEENTECRIIVMGRDSMVDKERENPNYDNFFDEPHIKVSAFDTPIEAYAKIANALNEIKNYILHNRDFEEVKVQVGEIEELKNIEEHISTTETLKTEIEDLDAEDNVDQVLVPEISKKKYKCEVCPLRFTKNSHLTRHFRTHTGEKPFKCNKCSRNFASRSYLVLHSRIHTGEKPFKCEICLKEFSQRSNLKRHSVTHTGEKRYQCKVCCRQFTQKSHLTLHSKVHTGEEPRKSLINHSATLISKPFKCKICLRYFSKHSNFHIHLKAHTGDKPFKCYVCCKKSTGYTGSNSLKCRICSRTFSNNSNLVRHSRIHVSDKPVECEFCLKKISQLSLVKHCKIHADTKPFTCEICLKQFCTNYNLNRHYKIHSS